MTRLQAIPSKGVVPEAWLGGACIPWVSPESSMMEGIKSVVISDGDVSVSL